MYFGRTYLTQRTNGTSVPTDSQFALIGMVTDLQVISIDLGIVPNIIVLMMEAMPDLRDNN